VFNWKTKVKVTEPSSIPYRTHSACAKRAAYPCHGPVFITAVPNTRRGAPAWGEEDSGGHVTDFGFGAKKVKRQKLFPGWNPGETRWSFQGVSGLLS